MTAECVSDVWSDRHEYIGFVRKFQHLFFQFNSDKVGDAQYVVSTSVPSLPQKLYGLTDANCRNAEKLKEVGFDFEEA